jgi:hypothetical protein
MLLTPDEWRAAQTRADGKDRPHGWSFRTDTRNLVETLEFYHRLLPGAADAIEALRKHPASVS